MTTTFEPNPNSQSLLSVRAVEMKAPSAFRTISEVAANLEVPQHVLRFWESKFQQVRPLKRGGGRRYYRPEDVTLLGNIKELLYTQGMTIRGVQKMLREGNRSIITRSADRVNATPTTTPRPIVNNPSTPSHGLSADKRKDVECILSELRTMRELLRQSGI